MHLIAWRKYCVLKVMKWLPSFEDDSTERCAHSCSVHALQTFVQVPVYVYLRSIECAGTSSCIKYVYIGTILGRQTFSKMRNSCKAKICYTLTRMNTCILHSTHMSLSYIIDVEMVNSLWLWSILKWGDESLRTSPAPPQWFISFEYLHNFYRCECVCVYQTYC